MKKPGHISQRDPETLIVQKQLIAKIRLFFNNDMFQTFYGIMRRF